MIPSLLKLKLPIMERSRSLTYSYCFLSVCLRLQVNPQNRDKFSGITPERGFADFIFAQVILHLVVVNFIG